MYKLYQTTIDRTKLLGEFKTEEEAKKEKAKKKKEGVGVISIKKYESK
jgi:hypothetical protein